MSGCGRTSSGPAATSGFSGEISMADASVPGSASTWSAGPSGPGHPPHDRRARLRGMIEHETEIPWADSPSATRNVADLVAGHAARTPDRTALVEPGGQRRTLTWTELDHDITAVAAGLAGQLVAGQRLGLSGPNSIEFVVAYLGALRAGIVVVPLSPKLTAPGCPRCSSSPAPTCCSPPEDPKIPGVRHLPLTRRRRTRPRGRRRRGIRWTRRRTRSRSRCCSPPRERLACPRR